MNHENGNPVRQHYFQKTAPQHKQPPFVHICKLVLVRNRECQSFRHQPEYKVEILVIEQNCQIQREACRDDELAARGMHGCKPHVRRG